MTTIRKKRNAEDDELVLKHVDFVQPRTITELTIRTDMTRHRVTKALHRLRDANKVSYDPHVYGWRTPFLHMAAS